MLPLLTEDEGHAQADRRLSRLLSLHRLTVPGIYEWFDVPDIAGLIAPRPLLIEMGVHDTCSFIARSTASAEQLAGYEALQRIYAAAGAEEDLWADLHPDEHAFANNKAHEFFGKYL